MKKRVFAALMVMLIVIATMVFVAAEEAEIIPDDDADLEVLPDEVPPEDVPVEDTTVETEPPTETVPTTPENHTFVGRVMEFVDTYRQEIIDICGFFGLAIASLFALFKQKKNGTTVIACAKSMLTNTSTVSESQTNVVGAVNNMIGAYNEMSKTYETYASSEDERNRLVGAMVVQNAAILEILSAVYANSKNLPQGVKDIVNLKYAKCLATLENDEKLTAFVKDVRSVVSGAEDTDTVTEGTEEVE
jgi:hypothetical protein